MCIRDRYNVLRDATGNILIGGGLGYFMSYELGSFLAQCINSVSYTHLLIKSAKEYSDVAVVVLSRKAGEGHNDIPMDVRKAAYDNNSDEYDDFPEGEHYLQLSQTERDMVDMVCLLYTSRCV